MLSGATIAKPYSPQPHARRADGRVGVDLGLCPGLCRRESDKKEGKAWKRKKRSQVRRSACDPLSIMYPKGKRSREC